MAKTISINFLENSIVMDDQQEAENKATRLTVDFTGAGVDTWAKWVDYKAADGTGMPVSLGLGVIVTHEIPSAVLKKGMLFIQAYAMDGYAMVKGKVFGIQVNPSLNITTNTTNYDPTLLGTFQQALSDMEMQIDEVYDAYMAGQFDATLAVGTVSTGAPGTSVIITNTGTNHDAVFNFTIPKGDTGAQGIQGLTGASPITAGFVGNDMVFTKDDASTITLVGAKLLLKGDTGDTGNTGATGATGATIVSGSFFGDDMVFVKSDSSTVTLVGAKTALKGDQGIQGVIGLTGAQGIQGEAATITIGSVTTGNAGTSASVVNAGTVNDAVLKFIIPRGDVGESAYDVAVDNGFIGSELEWLASLNGADGAQLTSVAFVGNDMVFTKDDATTVSLLGAKLTLKGDMGATGTSIVSASFVGNDLVFVKSDASTVTIVNGKLALKGDTGATGAQGIPGNDGLDGKSAYEVAVTNGFVGTEAEWLLSLKGEQGAKGDDGYVGADGDSGVYIGAEAPTDPDKTVWIDTDEPYDVSTETILSLVDGSDISIHTHDGRYYTETEMDGLLSGKSNTGHGHAIADVTDLQTNLNLKAPLSNPTFTGLTELPLTTTLGGQDIRTLLMPKNWIINGMFDVWQRGTTQTTSDYGSDDRWQNAHQVSTKTHSRQAFTIGQTDVPNNPKYFSRTVVTSGNSSSSYVMKIQKVEDVTKISGKTMSYSFWAKADANKSMSVQVQQYFGTGGSLVVNSDIQKFNLTSAWQRFTMIMNIPSVVGKTIGDGNHTAIRFWFDGGSDFNSLTDSLGNQSGTFDIANVSLVEGSVAVECQNQPYADVLRDCQRYYFRLGKGASNSIFAIGIGENATRTKFLINLPLNFRRLPISSDVSFSDLSLFNVAVATYAATAISVDRNLNELVSLNVDVVSGAVARTPMFLIETTANAYLAFSAEL